MSDGRIVPSDIAVARLRSLGEVGERWLNALPQLVAELESVWRLRVEAPLPGASAAFVANAVMDDGRPAVLKVFLPVGAHGAASFHDELRALLAGGGDPYVEVYEHDVERGAMVLERLGRSLHSLGLTVPQQLDVIGQTLPRAWGRPIPAGLVHGGRKAAWLGEYIERTWADLSEPCAGRTIEIALAYARSRTDAYDAASNVLVHGDAHSTNVLQAEPDGSSGRFKLIDPEGLASEPAHDLAIILRELNRPLLDGDAVTLASQWCRQLEAVTGVGARPIWEWSSIERVSTGLLLLQLGEEDEGRTYLGAADLLARADGPS
jgi:streptomycin 6-kinase